VSRQLLVDPKVRKERWTFHITFALIYDKRIPSAATLFVADDSYPLDGAVGFKLATKVALRGGFVLQI
jgi:hypothetical protein